MLADRDKRANGGNDDPPPGTAKPSDGRHVFLKWLTDAEVEGIRETRRQRRSS